MAIRLWLLFVIWFYIRISLLRKYSAFLILIIIFCQLKNWHKIQIFWLVFIINHAFAGPRGRSMRLIMLNVVYIYIFKIVFILVSHVVYSLPFKFPPPSKPLSLLQKPSSLFFIWGMSSTFWLITSLSFIVFLNFILFNIIFLLRVLIFCWWIYSIWNFLFLYNSWFEIISWL